MTQARRLRHPPIQEAVIDFHLAGATKVGRDALEEVAKAMTAEGWRSSVLNRFEAAIGPFNADLQVSDVGLKNLSAAFDGYMVQDAKGEVIYQLRAERVTVSHVRKYTQWEDLVSDATRCLEMYVKLSKASTIHRMGTRYINRIQMPEMGFDAFGEFLEVAPRRLGDLQSGIVKDFLVQQVVKEIQGEWNANISIGTAAPIVGETANSIVIDVDVYKTCDIVADSKTLIRDLSAAREIKNQVFFGLITDRALEAYE